MTIGLSYNNDLSRVQIELTSLPADVPVLVERSANELYWETVRGGVSLPVVSGEADLDDFEFFSDQENFYRVTATEKGLFLPSSSGDYASTLDSAAFDITGDISLRADLTPTSWAPGEVRYVLNKYDSSTDNRSYGLRLQGPGTLSIIWSEDGIGFNTINSSVGVLDRIPVNGRLAIRADFVVDAGADNKTCTFYTAPTIDGPWTQLGEVREFSNTTNINSGAADLIVGPRNDGTIDGVTGTVHAVEVWEGVGSAGTVVANPRFDQQTTGASSFDDGEGNTWTINGDAIIVNEFERDSITPSLDGQIWLKSIEYPFLNRPIDTPFWDIIERLSRSMMFNVQNRSMPVASIDLRDSQSFQIQIATHTLAEARDLDLVLAASGVFFIHVPPEDDDCEPVAAQPGGYVIIGDTVQRHVVPGSSSMTWTLPCRVVAPPSPQVTAKTMVWGTVFNLYGSWGALISSNPTWGDLLEMVGSPDDLVVI